MHSPPAPPGSGVAVRYARGPSQRASPCRQCRPSASLSIWRPTGRPTAVGVSAYLCSEVCQRRRNGDDSDAARCSAVPRVRCCTERSPRRKRPPVLRRRRREAQDTVVSGGLGGVVIRDSSKTREAHAGTAAAEFNVRRRLSMAPRSVTIQRCAIWRRERAYRRAAFAACPTRSGLLHLR